MELFGKCKFFFADTDHDEAEINVYIELVEKYGGSLAKKWGPDISHVIVATQQSSFFKNVCIYAELKSP